MALTHEALREQQREIRLIVLDVDGVLTDGQLFLGDGGEQYKAFHSRDGHGLRLALRAGLELAILTGRQSEVVRHRMQDLGIRHIRQGCSNKGQGMEAILADLGVSAAQTAYVGDDVIDLPAMRRVGLSIAVADAHPLVLQHADWCTRAPGGRGAVREICEEILEAQALLDGLLVPYLQA